MKIHYTFLTIVIGILITFLQPQIALAICSNKQVDEIAEKITVLIDSKASGSGVIIKREGNTYTVLTAYHVVKNSQLKYEIVTPDNQRYPLYQTVKLLDKNIDLAVLQFNSSRNYQVAQFGNSQKLQRRTKVYVAGFPVKTGSVNVSVYDCRDGKLIDNITNINTSLNNNGYNLIYDNPTLSGMSGGPVLNDNSQVIGIHGRGEQAIDIDIDLINSSVATVKSGRNLGIASSIFLKLLARIGLDVNVSSVTETISTNSNSESFFSTERLEELLSQGNFQEADEETKSLILRMSQSSNVLNAQSIPRLSCASLSNINRIWRSNSQGRFGFAVQAQKWKSLFGNKFEATNEYFDDFATELGWRYRGRFLPKEQINYSLNAPVGHLPRLFLDGPIWGKFIAYLDVCKI
ncbi:GUN4 domain-containing protein [Sphaerospermopsis aphanizomenoides BCCUSP55]|uniref:GUN4 domain-containing protein n=1 Tax=Sphaerospermopsis aphanizomenoides TaxID=459663 RepID=UPI0019052E58|nr:GUN4 domain-containing protein [Sphaerospermopsis aphanizomenoides]MBK1988765.1 GUN4 domain-containing protein [Sphaerospermopsis aphanizomenoides BCCUSP55]